MKLSEYYSFAICKYNFLHLQYQKLFQNAELIIIIRIPLLLLVHCLAQYYFVCICVCYVNLKLFN